LLEEKWRAWELELLFKDFEDRAKLLKLERARENAAIELRNAARLAETAERSRIAQDIHDHVGHEITGALFALQAAAKRDEIDAQQADVLLNCAISRLENAYGSLRETVYNLKPAKLRGIQSCGMLLAAGDKGGTASDGSPAERCEVLDAGDTPTGTRLLPEGAAAAATPAQIDIDTFFSFPIAVSDFAVHTGAGRLCLNGKPLCSSVIKEGKVN
jgi:tRNA-binding EMAP/Myf-like protein